MASVVWRKFPTCGLFKSNAGSERRLDPHIYIVVPTFRETGKVESFLGSFNNVGCQPYTLFIANGNPGDETSLLLRVSKVKASIQELEGNAGLYWSGLQNLGLRAASRQAGAGDGIHEKR
ncbi:MAG: hypothetical protein ABSC18_01350 [Verrucomicrobiota bacterium]|jgi:hypothetical protein